MASLQINVLGKFEVILNGEVLTWFPTDRVRALLLILAVDPQKLQARSTLASMLWSESPDKLARRSFRGCLMRLRKLLGDSADEIVIATRQTVHLESAESDINTLLSLANSNQPADLKAAADLIAGEFAHGFYLKNSPLFDDWLHDQRQALVQQNIQLLQTLLTHVTDTDSRLQYAQQLVALSPYDDGTHRTIMAAWADAGNVPAALAHFDNYAKSLNDNLSAKPELETRNLHAQLLTSISHGPIVLHGFPAQVTPFIGRDQEQANILEQLLKEECRMITLLGVGGMGKTRLAIEVAQQLKGSQFEDGAYFVPLVTVTTADDVLASLHRALDLPTQGNDLEAQLLDYLRDKRLLLVLDNLEQLAGKLGFLARLLQHAPSVKILATSRDVVGISAEHRYPISGISNLHEASSILWSAIQRVAPDFDLSATNMAIGARICEQLHGVPLALELAATWVSTLDIDSIRSEIEQAYNFLESPMLDTPDRHRSLGAIFEHSWQLLEPERQTILAGTSIFRGGFDFAAARAVLGAGIHDLRRLVEQSLLVKRDKMRYAPHELIRQFSAEKLAALHPDTTRSAHAKYYLTLVAGFEDKLITLDALQAREKISLDLDNIVSAWRYALANNWLEDIAKALCALTRFYQLTGRYSEGSKLFVETIDQLDVQTDATLLAQLYAGCALLYQKQTQYDASIAAVQQALAAAKSVRGKTTIADSLRTWGRSLRARGDYRLAMPKLQEALAACEGEQTNAIRADILGDLALIAAYGIAPAAAIELATKGLDAVRQSGDKMGEAFSILVLAFARMQNQYLSDALRLAEEGLALSKHMGDRVNEALGYFMRGRARFFAGNFTDGNNDLIKSRVLYQAIDQHLGQIIVLTALANSYLEVGDGAAVLHHTSSINTLPQAKGTYFHWGHSLALQGQAHTLLGEYNNARKKWAMLEQLTIQHGLPATVGYSIKTHLGALELIEHSAESALEQVTTTVDELMQYPDFEYAEIRLILILYKILTANNDPRAEQILEYGHKKLMRDADRIEDVAQRRSYLENIPKNVALIKIHHALHAAERTG